MEVYKSREINMFRWIFAVLLVVFLSGLILLVKLGYTQELDDSIRYFFYGLRADWLTAFFKGVTFMANPLTLTAICIALLVFPKTTFKFGIPVALVTGLGALTHKGIKHLILRERPDAVIHLIEESGYSLPSGHANAGLIFYFFLAFLLGRALKAKNHEELSSLINVVFALLIFLIGISRIYLGVHYPTDIIAGWCLGGILLIIFMSLYDSIYPMKYHMGDQVQQWGKDEDRTWIRPEKPSTDDNKQESND